MKFDKTKKNELLQGRTITSLAKKIGISVQHLTNVLNGKQTASKFLFKELMVVTGNEDRKEYFLKKEV